MSKTTDDKGRPLFQRTPNQASRIFGLDQQRWDGSPGGATVAVPRPKFLFLVRFVRGPGQGSPVWQNGLTFAVKSFDRPSVSPQLQQLNQYNKKRIVQTGLKYEPVNIEFHDTVDAVVNRMWQEYASYYFGDFRRSDQYDWAYDVTLDDFNDQGQGFGYTLPPGDKTSASYLEAANFFERVECYQLFGGHFIRFDLVHPKISRYSPDEMSYAEGGQPHGIRMTFEYEAVVNHQDGNSIPISSSQELSSLFGGALDGNVYSPPANYAPNINTINLPFIGNATRLLSLIPGSYTQGVQKINNAVNMVNQVTQIPSAAGGALAGLGSFSFGGTSSINTTLSGIMSSDLAKAGSSALSGVSSALGINSPFGAAPSISTSDYEAAVAVAQSTNFGSDAMVAAAINGGDVISTLNASRDSSSQVGVRVDTNTQGDEPPDYLA